MTNEKFDEVNELFNSLINENELTDSFDCIDGESLISRVYKKCGTKIDSKLLPVFLLYNKHIEREEYEVASVLKQQIINLY